MKAYHRTSIILALAATTVTTAATTTTAAPAASTTAATAAPVTTTTAAAPETTAAALTTAQPENSSDRKAAYTAVDGKVIYEDELHPYSDDEWAPSCADRSLMRISTGMYHDSESEPELFEKEDFIYSGEMPEYGGLSSFAAGDSVGGLTVSSAQMMFEKDMNNMVFSNSLELDGELTLTGVLRFHYDEQYTIARGDMIFIPDGSYKGYPVPCDPLNDRLELYANFDSSADKEWNVIPGEGIALFSDAPRFRVGNYFDSYAGNGEVSDVVGSADQNLSRRVEITLTDITLSCSEQFGERSHAKIVSIKPLD